MWSNENTNIGGRDKLHVYRGDTIIADADPATFKIINWEWQCDKSHCFHQGAIVKAIDPASFVTMQNNYSKDKNNVYYYDDEVTGADPTTFEVDAFTFVGKDKFGCYHGADKVDCSHTEK